MQPHEHQQYRQRDAASLFMLGAFFLVMGSLVMIGSAWCDRQHALVVNVGAALVLLSVGGGMVWVGYRYKSSATATTTDAESKRGDT